MGARIVKSSTGLTRRQLLAGLGAGLGTMALAGCSSGDEPDPEPSGPLDAIDTIVVLCMENRSFDHCLGSLRLLEGRTDIDGLRGTEWNPAPEGGRVTVHPLTSTAVQDPPHEWDNCHLQWGGGANNGFVASHAGPNQADAMGYYTRRELPVTYALADAGAICHGWHASVMGPTWPNRFYLHGATSHGEKAGNPVTDMQTVWDLLARNRLDGVNYYHDIPWAVGGFHKTTGFGTIQEFFAAAAAGTLPAFSIIDPQFFGVGANDDHPAHDVEMGQALISTIVTALGASPQWNRCMFVLTYDEHGGFFDHVPPPSLAAGVEPEPDFQQLGFRVPGIVIGPTVRRGVPIADTLEHASIAATLSRRFRIPHLNARSEAANDLSVCLDPALVDAPLPAPVMPQLTISRSRLAARACPAVHEEMARMRIPAHLDRRAQVDAITDDLLAIGEELGTVKLVD
jgi:phospholipase C